MSVTAPLFIGPAIIPPTYLSHKVIARAIDEYQKEGYPIQELHGPQAIRPVLSDVLRSHPEINVILYAGHGAPEAICGESLLCDLILPEDASALKGKVVVALPTCDVGAKLGPHLVENGVKAFFGSVEPMFAAFKESDHDYETDWLDYMLTFYSSLRYKTFGEALADYRFKGLYYVNQYKQKRGEWQNADWYISSTEQNVYGFTLIGDPNDRLPSEKAASKPDIWLVIREMLLGFGAVAGLAAGVVAPIVIDYAVQKTGVRKEYGEVAKVAIPLALTAAPIP